MKHFIELIQYDILLKNVFQAKIDRIRLKMNYEKRRGNNSLQFYFISPATYQLKDYCKIEFVFFQFNKTIIDFSIKGKLIGL